MGGGVIWEINDDVSIQNNHEIYYLCSAFAARADLRKRPEGKSHLASRHKSWLRNVSYIAVANCDKSRVSMDSQAVTVNCRDQSWWQCIASPAHRDQDQRAGHDLI